MVQPLTPGVPLANGPDRFTRHSRTSGFVGLQGRRGRLVIVAGIAVISALAWVYTIDLAWEAASIDAPAVMPWGAAEHFAMLVMWSVMMVAMMLPSAAPMILIFAAIMRRRRRGRHGPYGVIALFALAYIVVWTGFSLLATTVNWALHQGGALSAMMGRTGPLIGAGLLLIAGVYQWTPVKDTCLRRCRSPLAFLLTEWREGLLGALSMGLRHGVYCLLCCWALMSLLFALGIMNLMWIALLSVIVLAEKILPRGREIGRVLGAALVTWSIVLLLRAIT